MRVWYIFLLLPFIYSELLQLAIELSPYDLNYSSYTSRQIENDMKLDMRKLKWQHNLGQMMHKRYVEDKQFISNTFSREELGIYAVHSNRILPAVQAQLLGLYFPKSENEKGCNIEDYNFTEWIEASGIKDFCQVFNITKEDINNTQMIGDIHCSGVFKMLNEYKKQANERSPEDLKIEEMMNAIYGEEMKYEEEARELYKSVRVNSFLNVTHEGIAVHKILSSGFLREAKELIDNKVNSPSLEKRKLILFITNRFILDSVLLSLDIDLVELFNPTSPLFLELYEGEEYSVKIRYGKEVIKTITLKEFNKLIQDNTYELDIAKYHCNTFNPKQKGKESHKEIKAESTIKPGTNVMIEYLVLAIMGMSVLAAVFTLLSCCIKDTTRVRKIHGSKYLTE